MRPPKILTSKHNIAVVGLYRSGKTVFITSLINHIKHHRPEELKIGKGDVKITFDEELSTRFGTNRFPYDLYRYQNTGRIPKTKDTHEYRCSFFRSDWTWCKGELSLIDTPGERLPDLAITKMNYEQWSDWLLEQVFQDPHYRDIAEEYRSLATGQTATESSVVDSYRKLMAELYLSYRPIITPSTYLLSQNRQFNGAEIYKGDYLYGHSGLSEKEQFAPLPQDTRKSQPELVKLFAQRYSNYRNHLAMPYAKSLKRCNELVVLVDVTTLLSANTGMYNGNRALLEILFQILSPGKGLFGIGLDLFRKTLGGIIAPTGISRVAIVATKADKVHESQRAKLEYLIRDMAGGVVERQKQRTNNLDCEYFTCAAVKSTRSLPNGKLLGRFKDVPEEVEFEASDLPDRWPGNWSKGDFVFPSVVSVYPENSTIAPDHLGLDRVIEFLVHSQV